MTWKTEKEFESRDDIVRAIYSTESNSIYYIIDASNKNNQWSENAGFILCYWPNRNKDMETVSIIESFNSLQKAKQLLGEKTNKQKIN